MAVHFGAPEIDAEEVSLQAGAIPNNPKATTHWGIRVWDEWAVSRAMTIVGVDVFVPLTTPLLNIPYIHLVYWMGKIVLGVFKKDRSEYLQKALICYFKHFVEQNGIHNVNPPF